MLHKISWLQFAMVIGVGLVLYYAYVLLRYYGKELRDFAQGKNSNDGAGNTTKSAPGISGAQPKASPSGRRPAESPNEPVDGSPGQVNLFPDANPSKTDKPELFQVMEKVIALLRSLVADAERSGMTKEEILDNIQGVLSSYRYLRATPYEVAINNFIIRTCTTHFSLTLSDEDAARLWA